jgi:uncharacterized protein (DUF885 family)
MPLAGREDDIRDALLYRHTSMAQAGRGGFSERRFHDELLALGSVPYVFARAKMSGEPVPDF